MAPTNNKLHQGNFLIISLQAFWGCTTRYLGGFLLVRSHKMPNFSIVLCILSKKIIKKSKKRSNFPIRGNFHFSFAIANMK